MGPGPRAHTKLHRLLPAVALALLAFAFVLPLQPIGCSQTAHYALVRALAQGTPEIDRYHWQTCDKSYVGDHFYAAKPPGVALVALPLYGALEAAGLAWDEEPAVQSADALYAVPSTAVWPYGLLAAALPALLLALLAFGAAERIAAGTGPVVALALGTGTMVLPYATVYAAYVLSTLLGFAAFLLLRHERRGPPRPLLVLGAGALAAAAVTVELPLALLTALLGIYAVTRASAVTRGLAYAGGVAVGAMPLVAYNAWAFGNPFALPYTNAVIHQGQTGHDVVGANAGGFFGVERPEVSVAVELLLSPKGLLVISPVLALSVAGLVRMARGPQRADALLIASVVVAFLVYNAGYYLPFGGDSAGPRFLLPAVPFLALALAPVVRAAPLTLSALGLASVASMVAATVTTPLLGHLDTAVWAHALVDGTLTRTVLEPLAGADGWTGALPFLLAVAAAVGIGGSLLPTAGASSRDAATALVALAGWLAVAATGNRVLGAEPWSGSDGFAVVVVAASAATAAWLAWRHGPPAAAALLPLALLAVPPIAGRQGALAALCLAVLLLSAGPAAAVLRRPVSRAAPLPPTTR